MLELHGRGEAPAEPAEEPPQKSTAEQSAESTRTSKRPAGSRASLSDRRRLAPTERGARAR